jgi:hypothetical protein
MRTGDVIHLSILGRPMIVLNSVEAAVELLEKRGSNYSDRPDFPMFYLYLQSTSSLVFTLTSFSR